MRIFTLGRNGIPLFLFALILFSGTFSTYGQACPTVAGSTQTFCDSESYQVSNLVANEENVFWYAEADSTTPLRATDLLVNGEDYFADFQSGSCTARPSVTVTILESPDAPEILGIKSQPQAQPALKQSVTSLSFCVDDINNSEIFLDEINVDAEFPDTVQWYASQTSNEVLDPAVTELQHGAVYWVDQANATCRSDRRSVSIVLNSEEVPTGPALQEFCAFDNPTLGSIDASGNNRYYNTETGSSPLNENTRLAVGTTTYYVSTYNAQTNCESTERMPVEVTVNPLAITEESQSFCESMSEGNNLSGATVAHLTPEGGIWYADSSFSAPLAPETELQPGEDYFLQVENCATTKVNVTVFTAPNAGRTSAVSYCINAGVIDIYEDIEWSTVLNRAPDRGTINHPAFEGDLTFNPADLGVGTFELTHTVAAPEGSTCEPDTAEVTITILDALNAGDDITETICSAAFEDTDALAAQFAFYLDGRDLGGTFSSGVLETTNPLLVLAAWKDMYDNNIRTFSTTYTVTHENGCADSAVINVTVVDSPVVGADGSIQLQKDVENEITLEEALTDELANGAWTNEAGDPVDGTFAPQEAGTYTYTVTAGECSGTATVTVVAAPQDCPVVTETDTTQTFCESIGTGNDGGPPAISDLSPEGAVWFATATSEEALDPATLLVDGASYFADSPTGDCPTRPEVVVDLIPAPSAGSTTFITVCSNEEPFDLVGRFLPSSIGPAQPGGTFSPALASGTTIFDPAVDAGVEYKYTVLSTTNCDDDSARITVTIAAAPNAGEDIAEEFCLTAETLPTAEDLLAMYGDDTRDQNGTFNPTLEELALAYATEPFGTFATTYTVTSGTCTDTASLSVKIEEQVPANAGGNVTPEVCSTAGVQNLSDLLGPDAILGGDFSAPYEDGTFDPSTAGAEPVVITYTVNEENACVIGEDSATLTITIVDGPNPGENGSITLAMTAEPVNLFDSLGGTPDEGGTWTPGNENGDLDPSTFVPGDYVYTYTVANENCEASATVTVTITGEVICPEITQTEQAFCESILTGNNSRLPNVSDLLPSGATWYASADATEALAADTPLVNGEVYFAGNAEGTCEARESVTVTLDDSPNAGSTTSLEFCEGGEPVDLLPLIEASILGAPDAGGTFSPALASGTTVFDPAVDAAGTYTYSVESTNEVCPADEASITITITPAATAGEDFTLNFCATDEPQDLFTLLPEGVSTDGTFEGIEDGIFDPAVDAAGEFTYSVVQTGECEGTSTAVVTIAVSEVPAAPVAEAQSFCISEGATVGELVAEGDALVWYTDEALATPADEADALVAGTYYVTNTSEGGCESAATAVAVTLTDAATPTLAQDGNVFCEFENPTIAELAANVTATGNITWYDAATGGNVVSGSELLEDGVTYYAASTDATSACESSVRLAVTVDLSECPVVIPEAFSPNNDGINDTFEITYIAEEFPNYTIEIYNRWGNIVFKGNASTPNWDGVSTESRSLGDSVLPVGVYFYIVNFNDGQTAPTQGRLYLSR